MPIYNSNLSSRNHKMINNIFYDLSIFRYLANSKFIIKIASFINAVLQNAISYPFWYIAIEL